MDERSWRPAEPDCVGWSRPLPRPQLTPTSSGGGWSGFHTSGSASFGSDTTTSGRVCSMPFHSSQAFTPVLFALMLTHKAGSVPKAVGTRTRGAQKAACPPRC